MSFLKFFHFKRLFQKKDPKWDFLETIVGYPILNKEYYQLALIDPSNNTSEKKKNKCKEDNDRLEFLGDSIIGASVSKYLYLKYPHYEVGTLSALKSRIVSREIGDTIAVKIGLQKIIQKNHNNHLAKDALGNALEALVGAIFLDKGFETAENFILKTIIPLYDKIKKENPDLGTNYKNKLLEWGIKEKIDIQFKVKKHQPGKYGFFISEVFINDRSRGTGKSRTKKGSEQAASKHTLIQLRKSGELKSND